MTPAVERSASPRAIVAAVGVGAAGMFATMYSTQAVLPEIARDLHVSAAVSGLSIAVVVLGVAAGSWVLGPLSDRVGRRPVLVGSAAALVLPTALLAVAPGIVGLLALRLAQGLVMPGLLAVAFPYLHERLPARLVGTAMGVYTSALVAGGLVGRLVPAVLIEPLGWRGGLAVLAVPVALGALLLARALPADPPRAGRSRAPGIALHGRSPALLLNALTASAAFLAFQGVFTYVGFRLSGAPFDLGPTATGLVFGVWVVGVLGPSLGRLAGAVGPPRVLPILAVVGLGACGLALVPVLPVLVVALAALAAVMFTTVTACQILLPRLAPTGTGAAASLHLTIYYLGGAVGGYGPGLAWEAGGWHGVVAVAVAALGVSLAASLVLRRLVGRP